MRICQKQSEKASENVLFSCSLPMLVKVVSAGGSWCEFWDESATVAWSRDVLATDKKHGIARRNVKKMSNEWDFGWINQWHTQTGVRKSWSAKFLSVANALLFTFKLSPTCYKTSMFSLALATFSWFKSQRNDTLDTFAATYGAPTTKSHFRLKSHGYATKPNWQFLSNGYLRKSRLEHDRRMDTRDTCHPHHDPLLHRVCTRWFRTLLVDNICCKFAQHSRGYHLKQSNKCSAATALFEIKSTFFVIKSTIQNEKKVH